MTVERLDAGTDMARWVQVLVPASQLAERIAGTEFVPAAMRDKPDVVTAAIMYGDEIGVGPMQALAGIHVVEGKPSPSAELMRAMILRAGHSIAVHEMTAARCRISGLRAGRPETERAYVEWNMDQARQAGLANRSNWRSYPRALLLARATSDLARLLFPDVIKGLSYVAENESVQDLAPEIQEAPEAPAPAAPQRKKRPRPEGAPPPARGSLPSPPRMPPATIEHPAPDGSVDVPLPEDGPEAHRDHAVPPVAPARLPDTPNPDLDPTAEPEAVPVPISDRRRTAVMTAWGNVPGPGGTTMANPENRDLRLLVTSGILQRPIESTNDVTNTEALGLLRALSDLETGRLDWEVHQAGDKRWAEVFPTEDAPPEEP